jgi:hypothetical protein
MTTAAYSLIDHTPVLTEAPLLIGNKLPRTTTGAPRAAYEIVHRESGASGGHEVGASGTSMSKEGWRMRLLLISMALGVSIFVTPVPAQTECCQCGPSACGPPAAGDCAGCELVPNATCNGETGECAPLLEASFPSASKAAPAVGDGALVLLAAALTALGLSLLARRRREN